MKMINFLMCNVLVFTGLMMHAQTFQCGTTHLSPEQEAWLTDFQHKLYAGEIPTGHRNVVEVPVQFHVVGTDNGTGYADYIDILETMCDMNQIYFADANIYFYLTESIHYIDNSDWYTLWDQENDHSSMMWSNNVSGVINVYIVNEIIGGTAGFYAYSPDALTFEKVFLRIDRTVVAHELGHYLSLPHPFSGWEGSDYETDPIWMGAWEKMDGSNCLTTGDGFCDTPPDYLSRPWFCPYSENYTDPNGVPIETDGSLLMSYSGCGTVFSDDQNMAMYANIIQQRQYLLNHTNPGTAALSSMLDVYPFHEQQHVPSSIVLQWEPVGGATEYLIEVTDGNFFSPMIQEIVSDTFFTSPLIEGGETYEWRVKPYSKGYFCSDFSDIFAFTTATFSAELESTNNVCPGDEEGTANITVTGGGNLVFNWYAEDPDVNTVLQAFHGTLITDLPAGNYHIDVIKNITDTLRIPFEIKTPEPLHIEITEEQGLLLSNVEGGTPPYALTWSNGQTTTINTSPLEGTNNLFVMDVNGCFSNKTAEFSSGITGIQSALGVKHIDIYPNPANNAFSLFVHTDQPEVWDVQLFSSIGALAMKQDISVSAGEHSYTINIEGLNAGVYIVRIKGESGDQAFRLLKMK